MQSCGVARSVGSDARVVDDKGVDVVVSDDVRHNFLVLLSTLTRPSTMLLRALRLWLGDLTDNAAGLIGCRAFLRYRSLEDDLRTIVGLLLQALAECFSVTWWMRLVVKVQYFLCFRRLALLLGLWRANALSLQGLTI